jgi:hypothetical protein
MPFPKPDIGHATLKLLGEKCPHLQAVNFCGIVIEAAAMEHFLLGPALVHQSLTRIDVSYCSRREYGSMNTVGLEFLVEQCPHLVELRFDDSLTEHHMALMKNKLPWDSTPVFFTEFMPKLTDLQDLSCVNAYDNRGKGALQFLSSLSALRAINCERISTKEFSGMVSNPSLCQSLRSLSSGFTFQDHLEPTNVVKMTELSQFYNLEHLSLTRGIWGSIGERMPELVQGLSRLNSRMRSFFSYLRAHFILI